MIDDAIDQDDDAIEGTRSATAAKHVPAVVGGTSCAVGGSTRGCNCSATGSTKSTTTARLPRRSPTASETDLALHAFALTVHRYAIPKQHFLDLAEGCRMDLVVSRYATWPALENYCYHVAGVVGLIMSSVFGLTNDAARAGGEDGECDAVDEHPAARREGGLRSRPRLPAAGGHGAVPIRREGPRRRRRQRRVPRVDAVRGRPRFRTLFREGGEGLCWLADDGSRLTASAMAVIYAGILGAIERQGYDVFSSRAPHGGAQKLRRVPGVWRWRAARRGAVAERLLAHVRFACGGVATRGGHASDSRTVSGRTSGGSAPTSRV